jgi:hypothetical protein
VYPEYVGAATVAREVLQDLIDGRDDETAKRRVWALVRKVLQDEEEGNYL